MVAEATARNSSPPPSTSVRFELYDGSVFPFGDEGFDRLFTVNTIYFWEDPAHTLSEVHRVLKPGGRAPRRGPVTGIYYEVRVHPGAIAVREFDQRFRFSGLCAMRGTALRVSSTR